MKHFLKRSVSVLLFLSLFFCALNPSAFRSAVRAEAAAVPFDRSSAAVTVPVSSIRELDPEDAALFVRQAMKERREAVEIRFHFDLRFVSQTAADAWIAEVETWYERSWNSIVHLALEHTGVPTEGDYLAYHLKSYVSGYELLADAGGADLILTYSFSYLSDAAEEADVTAVLDEVMTSLGLTSMPDAGKIRAIYRWITENVVYDDRDDRLPYTAYGALIDRGAVCQGYAGLLYRMALTAGLDARIVSGTGYSGTGARTGDSGPHAWNIVRIGDRWYNLDSTWDAGQSSWHWFLRGSGTFEAVHVPERTDRMDYASAAFRRAYPMADEDYSGPIDTAGAPTPPPPSSDDGTGELPEPLPVQDEAPAREPETTTADESGWTNPFDDVSEEDVFYDAIRTVYENGLFVGVSDTKFAPEETMTRAMFVTVFGRLAGIEPDSSRTPSFADTEAGLWYSPYVDWAAEAGYIRGYGNGRFGPDDPVTREQAAVITARMASSEGFSVSSPLNLTAYDRDDPVSDWAWEAVAWALDTGIYPTRDSRIIPHDPASRSFVAWMLARYGELRER